MLDTNACVMYGACKVAEPASWCLRFPARVVAGVREAGWSPEGQELPNYRLLLDGQEAAPTMDNIHSFGRAAVAALQAHEDSPAFSVSVNADEVPDYYDIIKARRPLQACPSFPCLPQPGSVTRSWTLMAQHSSPHSFVPQFQLPSRLRLTAGILVL